MSEIIYSNIQSKTREACWCCKDGATIDENLFPRFYTDMLRFEDVVEECINSFSGTVICTQDESVVPC